MTYIPSLKKVAASLAVVAMMLTMIPSDASARDHRHGGNGYHGGGKHYVGGHRGGRHYGGHYRGNRHYRGHYRSHYHGGGHYRSNAWVPFAVLGTAALTYAIVNDNNNKSYATAQGYSATKPCHMAYRDQSINGQLVRMAATMCYDSAGTAYLVKDSEHEVPIQ